MGVIDHSYNKSTFPAVGGHDSVHNHVLLPTSSTISGNGCVSALLLNWTSHLYATYLVDRMDSYRLPSHYSSVRDWHSRMCSHGLDMMTLTVMLLDQCRPSGIFFRCEHAMRVRPANPDCLSVHSSTIAAVLDTITNGREQEQVTFFPLGILWLTNGPAYVNTLLWKYVPGMTL